MSNECSQISALENNILEMKEPAVGFYVAKHVRDNIVWRINLTELTITDVSCGVKDVLGYEVDEVVGLRLEQVLTSASYEQLLKNLPLWLQELNGSISRSLHIVGRVEHPVKDSEQTIWVEINAQLFLRSSGEIIAVGVSCESTNKATLFSLYNELAEQRKILQETLDMQPCYLSCYDSEGRYLFVSFW